MAPASHGKLVVKPNSLWRLGPHMLWCGDSTDKRLISPLFLRARPNLMVTDPPYGVSYDPEWRNNVFRENGSVVSARAVGKVQNDQQTNWTSALRLFPGSVAYVWCASWFLDVTKKALHDIGFDTKSLIIWVKTKFAISRGHYHWQHEPLWYAVRRGKTSSWRGGHSQTTIWRISNTPASDVRTNHSTQKPIECMARPVRHHTGPGEWVYDPFLGSGTTLMACELLKRRCLGVELSPEYCEMAIRRWMRLSGGRAIRLA